eukprot:818867_1
MIENNSNNKQMDTETVYNEEIIAQLMMFGYEKDNIMSVMKCVINANNINQIRDKLDEKTDADEQAIIDIEMHKNIDTPSPPIELCIDIDGKKAKQARFRKCILQEIISTEE